MDEIISFGEWIKLRRRALDLSQEALAQRVSYSVATIRKIESDGQRPSRDLAVKLAEQLRVAPDEHETFVSVARGNLRVSRLPPPNLDVAAPRQYPVAGEPARLPCPYPGLLPFSEYTSDLFFGRDAEIHDILARLHLHPFVVLIGPSGSGKSSLMFAGVIPALRRSGLFGDGAWLVRTIRPGAEPLAALAAALGTALDDLPRTVADLLARAPNTNRLLLVVDQFEELFTVAQDGVAAFQQALLQLIACPGCYVALTARADFYPDLMVSQLWPTLKQHRVEVVPLDSAGLRQAIVRPAQAVGVTIESALVERLVADAAEEPGALPIIQETLRLLWDRLEQRNLPLGAYEAMLPPGSARHGPGGRERHGLQVAMARRADAAVAALRPEQQAIARRIFLRLVQFGAGRADTRRQQSVAALRSVGDNPALFNQPLLHLAEMRLLTLSGTEHIAHQASNGEPGDGAHPPAMGRPASGYVDIAHEALIDGWPTLQGWLAERREAEQDRRRLEAKTAEWIRLGRKRNGLLDEVELAEAERWVSSPDTADLGYDEDLLAFVQASRVSIEEIEQARLAAQQQELAHAQALAEAERQRAEAQTRAVRSLRGLVALLSLLVLITAGLLARPVWLRQRAIWLTPTTAIPGGTAMIGSANGDQMSKPIHPVTLPPFAIDTHEVSNAQYCLCRQSGACRNDPVYGAQSVCSSDIADLPVTKVTLVQANEYCGWIGRRLPTEMEWEWAARGSAGRPYPTGTEKPIPGQVNLSEPGKPPANPETALWPVDKPSGDRTPDYGVMDMAGNVQEWTISQYLPYDNPSAQTVYWPERTDDPSLQVRGYVVVRGGLWPADANSADATRRYLSQPDNFADTLGFRCLQGVSLQELKQGMK